MLSEIDHFYLDKEEPLKSCLLALRGLILSQDKNITCHWKYKLPFFYYNEKMFCYLWIHKKYKQPYIGIVKGNQLNHPDLLLENRSQIKILLIDPEKDIPVKTINTILKKALLLYE